MTFLSWHNVSAVNVANKGHAESIVKLFADTVASTLLRIMTTTIKFFWQSS